MALRGLGRSAKRRLAHRFHARSPPAPAARVPERPFGLLVLGRRAPSVSLAPSLPILRRGGPACNDVAWGHGTALVTLAMRLSFERSSAEERTRHFP